MREERRQQTIGDFNLYEMEDVAYIERQVDVGLHLPQDIIGKGLEFTEIREIENKILTDLWRRGNKIMRNLYIQLADSEGINAYEKLIGEKLEGDLEEKRRKVYALWNMVRKWTHRTLEEWLDNHLGEDNYELKLFYNDYVLEISIVVNANIVDHNWLAKRLRRIIPANLGIRYRLKLRQKIYYGHYAQKIKHIKAFPYKPQDKTESLPIYYGGYATHKTVKRVAKMPEVWTIDDYNRFLEVKGEGGNKLKYGD